MGSHVSRNPLNVWSRLFRRLVVVKSFPNCSNSINLQSLFFGAEQSRADMDEAQDNNTVILLRLLEPLKNLCKNLRTSVFSITSTASNLSFQSTISDFNDQLAPFLVSNLSQSLSTLHIHLQNLEQSASTGYWLWLPSLIQCKLINYQISNTATEIESAIGSWIDRERIAYLANILHDPSVNDDVKVTALREFEIRISSGYERDLQEIVLRTKLFNVLESVVCKSRSSKTVKEQCANTITALVDFNRDVFIGQVLMGGLTEVLIDMASAKSLQVLSSLMKLIGGPLAYEIERGGYIKTILGLLDSEEDCIRGSALDCVMELASLVRMEVIEGLIEEEGLIGRLMEMQEKGTGFAAGILTRFVGKMETNEGLEMGEMRRLRDEVLRRAREACVSEDEATSIVADVLWGSSPLILH